MELLDEGWTFAAAIVLGVAGIMRVFDAIWAFRYHGVLPSNLEDAIFGHSLKTYGWVYIVVAAILILSAPRHHHESFTDRSLDRRRRRCDHGHQRDLVDALLPDLVAHLHRHWRLRHLCPRSAWGREEVTA